MEIWTIWLLPFIAAVIGWFTNFIAVKMLFHPRKPIRLGLITLQGVFPKRQAQVAERVGKMVAQQLLSTHDIQQYIAGEENMNELLTQIEKKVDYYFEHTFKEKYPMVSRIMSAKIQNRIKEEFLHEVNDLVPKMIDRQIFHLKESLNIEKIITNRIAQFSSEKLEKLVWGILEKEFRFIEAVGAVIGFVIGIVQIGLISL